MWLALLGGERPPTVLVGHSMGGAVATWAASLQVPPAQSGQLLSIAVAAMLEPKTATSPAHCAQPLGLTQDCSCSWRDLSGVHPTARGGIML